MLRKVVTTVVAIFAIFLGTSILFEPSVPNEALELDRVFSHLEYIAREPHPSGSAAIFEVKNYILEQIKILGLEYQVQNFNYQKVEYNNILVKIGPTESVQQFMLVGHYDSVSAGPGAGDDGVVVATLLETLRILATKTEIKNTIYVLLTDGEESSAIGAQYFVKNPLVDPDKISLVANFEARGTKGVLLLFRTSNNNKKLLEMLVDQIGEKWAFSWMNDIFKMMPNYTDLTIFLNNGYQGVDFAIIGGAEHYHGPSDNIDNLSRGSAYQYIKTITDIANYFSIVDNVELAADADGIAFALWRGNIVVLPGEFMRIFGVVAAIISLVVVMFWFIKRHYKVKNSLKPITIIIFAFLTLISTSIMNGASYIFSISLIAMVVSAWCDLRCKNNMVKMIIGSLALVIFYVLFMPTIILIYTALPTSIIIYILFIIGMLPIMAELTKESR